MEKLLAGLHAIQVHCSWKGRSQRPMGLSQGRAGSLGLLPTSSQQGWRTAGSGGSGPAELGSWDRPASGPQSKRDCWRDLRKAFQVSHQVPAGRGRPHLTQGLTHFHTVGLHLPLIFLVHRPHVAVEEARGIRDCVASRTGEGDGQE